MFRPVDQLLTVFLAGNADPIPTSRLDLVDSLFTVMVLCIKQINPQQQLLVGSFTQTTLSTLVRYGYWPVTCSHCSHPRMPPVPPHPYDRAAGLCADTLCHGQIIGDGITFRGEVMLQRAGGPHARSFEVLWRLDTDASTETYLAHEYIGPQLMQSDGTLGGKLGLNDLPHRKHSMTVEPTHVREYILKCGPKADQELLVEVSHGSDFAERVVLRESALINHLM